MSLIDINNLTFSYEGSYDTIFEHVSFQIDTNWKLGLIGRNGRGKTTFLKLLMRHYSYIGTIHSSVQFDYFPYPVEDPDNLTMYVIESILPDYEHWRIMKEFRLLALEEELLYRPFNTLSNGEQTKVLLATLFLQEGHFLLIDEPTNHLDIQGRTIVSHYLSSKKSFILVSHDRKFLDDSIDHVLSINKNNIEIQKGNFSSWYLNKERQDVFERSQNHKLKNEIKRLEKTAKEKALWSAKTEKSKIGNHVGDRGYIGHKAAKMMKRSKTIEARTNTLIEEKSKLLKNIEVSDALKLAQLPYRATRFLTLADLSITYDHKTICKDIHLTLEKGDRIALIGKNGCGKSSIIKLLCGLPIPYEGLLQLGHDLKISYVSQDTSYLTGNLSDYALAYGIDESLFKAILRKLDFSREQFDKPMQHFSGGQKKKVLIARSLSEKAHLHIWDEPLNFIDVISRIQLEELLLAFQPTMLFVEHDSTFCSRIATKILYL